MEKVTLEVVKEMMDWYDDAKNPKAQEIADYVSVMAENTPLDASRAELFTQGVIFGYFLTTKGYIT